MAEKRMISKVISISEKVNTELDDIFHMLLYTWLIPHADDFGRLAGSAAKVRALVVPMLDKTKSDVERALQCLHNVGLIIWYEVDGNKYIQICNFDEHQSGLHKRTKSKIPEPTVDATEVPGNSGKVAGIPLEQNRTEENRREGKGTEQEQISGCCNQNPFQLFESEGFGTISATVADNLGNMIDDYGERWVCEAMKLSVFKGKRKLSYVDGILKNWKADGIDEPWKEDDDAKSQGRTQGIRHEQASGNSGERENEFAFLGRSGRS